MFDVLPAVIDPLRLADEGVRLCGQLKLKGMSRLTAMCADDQGTISIELAFERSAQGLRQVHGRLSADVHVVCQRCMQVMPLVLTTDTRLLLLTPGESAIDDEVDVLVAKPMPLSLLVEDELLLAMPMIPAHESGACTPDMPTATGKTEKVRKPFDVLSKLKRGES